MTPIPQEKPCTYADLLEWEEDVRAEIIHGEIRMLSAPLRIHQKVLRKLFLKIGNYLEGKTCEIYSAPFDVRLFQEEDDTPYDVDTVVEPDISVICDPSKLDDTGCKPDHRNPLPHHPPPRPLNEIQPLPAGRCARVLDCRPRRPGGAGAYPGRRAVPLPRGLQRHGNRARRRIRGLLHRAAAHLLRNIKNRGQNELPPIC